VLILFGDPSKSTVHNRPMLPKTRVHPDLQKPLYTASSLRLMSVPFACKISPNAQDAVCTRYALCCPHSSPTAIYVHSLGVALDPVLHVLLKLLAVLPVLVGDGRLDGIVRVGLDQERLDKAEHRDDLVRRLPLVGTQQTQAHRPLVIVANVGVVDLCSERHDGWLEGIFGGEGNLELEVAALYSC
jgi:hypothetical protein